MRAASNAKIMNAHIPAMTYNKVDAVVTDVEIQEDLSQWLHTAGSAGSGLAWDVVIDPSSEPQPEPGELKLARISRGAEFELMQRRPLRE